MDEHKRARSLKTSIEKHLSIQHNPDEPPTSKQHIDEDRENRLIKTLRFEQAMDWKDIASVLNKWRLGRGEAGDLTESAIYSRFVRNYPRTATAVAEIGFQPKDYIHLRYPNQYTQATEGSGTPSKAGKKRIKNFENATELKDNMRKRVKAEDHGELNTAEKTEQLVKAVAKVERNFWLLVADEMERVTTKMYEPEELESRYHAI